MHQGQDAVDMMSLIDQPMLVVAGVIATALVAWATIWLLQPVARRFSPLDHPKGGRKDHAESTPVTGGLGMALGLFLMFALVPLPMT